MKMELTDRRTITTVKSGKSEESEDILVNQMSCSLILNGVPAISSVCSPGDVRVLAYGYLVTQGFIRPGEEPLSMDQDGCVISVTINGMLEISEPEPVKSDYRVTPKIIFDRVSETTRAGDIFRKTGGTHSVSICTEYSLDCHMEDISRSAALEKSIGCACLANLEMDQSFVVLSSRVPVEFVRKTARAGIPIIAAVSAPTTQAADEAEKLGICLCGFVRGDRMNVYANKWRLGL